MPEEFRLKKIDEIRNHLIEEINRNELMSKKYKKVCGVLNYIEHLLIAISTITGTISAFASLVQIPIRITGFTTGLKICVITAAIKNYNSIIKKMRKKYQKTVLLAKSKLNKIEFSISKVLIDSNIIHDKFFLINNVPKEFYDMNEEIKNFYYK